ncbi:hypothetical protein C2E23DRAFT_735631 [Lenzites betulinus]|nr:hypothetical protein C2E23DRAFT_735631 [Lenzites betulinus]
MSTRHSFLSTTGLIRPPSAASFIDDAAAAPHRHARPGGTKPGRRTHKPTTPVPSAGPSSGSSPSRASRTKAGIVPLGPAFVVGIAVLLSLLFILAISCAFIADEDERPMFAALLDDAAANTPGIVLVGDDVDVDIDEPALTIRWSIVGCGPDFVLPGSEGAHGSAGCGLPAMPLSIFVDGANEPTTTYNPAFFPFLNSSGGRNDIQNMFQFDDDHVLDVHQARKYPFDTYLLTSTIRAVSLTNNQSLPIQRLSTIALTSSFAIRSTDTASYTQSADGSRAASRDLTLVVSRPAEARMYALLLFGVSWMLAHATMALVAFSWRVEGAERIFKHLAATLIVILLIPQLRNAMPDAPDLDGECPFVEYAIGFFPQMLVCAISALTLLAMMVKRELQALEESVVPEETRKEAPASLSTGLLRMRRGGSSVDINHMRNFSRTLSGFGRPAGL